MGVVSTVREAAVAGTFYPGDRRELRAAVDSYFAIVESSALGAKAIIAPHAGYVYSGPTAACAFASLAPTAERIRRVVLLGPSHFVPFRGLATSGAKVFSTPLGDVLIDRASEEEIADLDQVHCLPEAHDREHCLEVELPFLQAPLSGFQIVPLVVGEASPAEVAEVLDLLWGGPETVVVVSSDLSHFHDSATARRLDEATCETIEALDRFDLSADQACGCQAINGLLLAAHRRGMRVTTLDLRNSGDTAGPRDRVVGYGAWAFTES